MKRGAATFGSSSRRAFAELSTWAIVASTGACAPTPEIATPVAPIATAASAAPTAATDAGKATPPDVVGFDSVARSDAASCTVQRDDDGDAELSLRAKPDAAPYAILGKGRATVTIAPTNAGAYFEATTGAARVRGYVGGDDFVVHARRPIVAGGFVVTTEATKLVLGAFDGASATFGVVASRGVAFSAPPQGHIACADVSLTPVSFDATTALPAAIKGRFARLADRDVALSIEPGGAAVAKLRFANKRVAVVALSGTRTRVAVTTLRALYFGWVANGDLSRDSPPSEEDRMSDLRELDLGAVTIVGPPVETASVIEERRCTSDLRLATEVAGARTFVGTLAAPLVVSVVAREESFARIALPPTVGGGLWPARGATFIVPARDLAACAQQPITR